MELVDEEDEEVFLVGEFNKLLLADIIADSYTLRPYKMDRQYRYEFRRKFNSIELLISLYRTRANPRLAFYASCHNERTLLLYMCIIV